MRVLEAGESVYDSLFVSVDQHEWLVDSPGYYSIQACMHLLDEDILSAPLQIRVTPPRQREEEYIAQDYFSEDVGRILTFDGSQVLTKANDILREVVAQLPKSSAAIHAQVTLDLPRVTPYKLLNMVDAPEGSRYAIQEINPVEAETEQLSKLLGDPKGTNDVAQALGHIDYRYYAERLSEALKQQDRAGKAQEVVQCMHDTLKDRGVKEKVLEEISETININVSVKKKVRRKN